MGFYPQAEKLFTALILLFLTWGVTNLDKFESTSVLASTVEIDEITTPLDLQPLHTEAKFSYKEAVVGYTIARPEKIVDDPEVEYGEETVLDEGKDGKKTVTYLITFYIDKEDAREIIKTENTKPTEKVIKRGIKIIWRTLSTPDGEIKYWRKLHVWATHYDQFCYGCDQWTAIGMRAGKGVIAVDPKVIKLRSRVYVTGYGLAVAGDTGGAIKGNIIDLGFEDAKTAGWSARFTDIYLLDRAPY